MRRATREFIASVNFKIAVALKSNVPILEIISALEQIAYELDQKIESRIKKDKEPDG